MKKFLIIAAIIIAGVVAYSVNSMYAANNRYEDLPYTSRQLNALKMFYAEQTADYTGLAELSKSEWKAKVNDMLGVYDYIETSYFLPNWAAGCAYAFLSVIAIEDDLTGARYAHVLTHELLHFLHPTNSERQTEFLAFTITFESADPNMRLVALESISETINRTESNTSTDYICTGRIIDYLERRGLL